MSLNLIVTIVIPLLLGIGLIIASSLIYRKDNNTMGKKQGIRIDDLGNEKPKIILIRGKQVIVGFLVVAVATAFFIPYVIFNYHISRTVTRGV